MLQINFEHVQRDNGWVAKAAGKLALSGARCKFMPPRLCIKDLEEERVAWARIKRAWCKREASPLGLWFKSKLLLLTGNLFPKQWTKSDVQGDSRKGCNTVTARTQGKTVDEALPSTTSAKCSSE